MVGPGWVGAAGLRLEYIGTYSFTGGVDPDTHQMVMRGGFSLR